MKVVVKIEDSETRFAWVPLSAQPFTVCVIL